MRHRAKGLWQEWQKLVHEHAHSMHHINHACHICYFALIVFGGPYYVAAAGLLVIGLVTWITGVE